MKMKTNNIIKLMVLIMLSAHAQAISLFVGPSNIVFDDMIQGQSVEETMFVATEGNSARSIRIWIEGPMKDWVTITPVGFDLTEDGKFELPPNSKLDFNLRLELPESVDTGVYTGNILLRADPLVNVSAGTGLIIVPGMSQRLMVNVTNRPNPRIRVVDVTVNGIREEEPVEFEFTAINEGNVEVEPVLRVGISDSDKNSIRTPREHKIAMPRKRGDQRFTLDVLPEGIEPGQYYLDVVAYVGDEEVWKESSKFNVIRPFGEVVTTVPQTTTSLIRVTTSLPTVKRPGRSYWNYAVIAIVLVAVFGYLQRGKKAE